MTKLSTHFSLEEMTRSYLATRLGLENEPNATQKAALSELAKKVLDPIREEFGPFSPQSAFRSKVLNNAVGGSQKSQHMNGEAADIEVPFRDNLQVAKFIRDNLVFDQLILEFYTPGNPNSGWVHVSYVSPKGKKEDPNRGQVLTAILESPKRGKKAAEIAYKEGLPTGKRDPAYA